MTRSYDFKKIRLFLTEGFNDDELRTLCYDNPDFRPIYPYLTRYMGRAEIVDRLVEFAEQKVLLEKLLDWAKGQNFKLYQQYLPYYQETSREDLLMIKPDQPSNPTRVDFVLITPLEEERDALLEKMPNYKKIPPLTDDINVYFEAILPLASGNGSYRVVVTPLLGMGRVQAAAAIGRAIQQWQPRYVILVGIAGGVAANEIKPGDVLIANQIVDYELQKQTAKHTDIRWQVYPVSQRLLGAAQNFIDKTWLNLIKTERPVAGQPRRHIGPVASGDKVIDFARTLKKYQDVWSKLIGVEMEAGGGALSVLQTEKNTEFFMIRGVSDLADGEKNAPHLKGWRPYACEVAATYTIALIQSGPVPFKTKNDPPEAFQPENPTWQYPAAVPREVVNDSSKSKNFDKQVFSGKDGQDFILKKVKGRVEVTGGEAPTPNYHILWHTKIPLNPKYLFVDRNYLCLADGKKLCFFSPKGDTLFDTLPTTLEHFSLAEYDITGGSVTSSGNLLLTLLPRHWSESAHPLLIKIDAKVSPRVEYVYEAPNYLLSAPVVDGETVYLIQSGPELVIFESEQWKTPHLVRLPNSYNFDAESVSLAFAANRLCLALADGTILALDLKTEQLVPLCKKSDHSPLSPLTTDGWCLFFSKSTPSAIQVCAFDVMSRQDKWASEIPIHLSKYQHPVKSQLLVLGDYILVTAGDCLYGLDIYTGQQRWQYQASYPLKLGPKWTGETVVFIDNTGELFGMQVGPPKFLVTYHYNLRTPPTYDEWNSVTFTLVNIGYQTTYNTVLRLQTDEFKGVSQHHTQELDHMAPGEFKCCLVKLKPTTKGTTVPVPITIEYQDHNGQAGKQAIKLSLPVRRAATEPIRDEGEEIFSQGNFEYNLTALRALLAAALRDGAFTSMCRQYFSPVYAKYNRKMDQIEKINKLLRHVVQQQQVERLLAIVKEFNLTVYEQYIQEIKPEI